MTLRSRVKEIVERMPESFAAPIVRIPFSWRLGRSYTTARRRLLSEEETGCAFDAPGSLHGLRAIVRHAEVNTSFYRAHYQAAGFSADQLNSWDDWDRVPIVTRGDLQGASLADRCVHRSGGMKVNTGGTSGQPLEFLVDHRALGREWAHMHFIWMSHGYRTSHCKLTLRGKHFGPDRILRFNPVNNEFVANSNLPMYRIVDEILRVTKRTPIRWVHGYPSLVAEFASGLSGRSPREQRDFRDRLFGVLLGSEYPAPHYRQPIAELLSANIVSWYGHSEMAVLARESAVGVYSTFPTYGFAEAVPTEDGAAYRLVCTSIDNTAHPFVRYDTGDLIQPVSTRRGAIEFRVTDGRIGDFIIDRAGNRHTLTAVIFGRHHQAFEFIRHIQVYQAVPGQVTFLVTPRQAGPTPEDIMQSLDLAGLDIRCMVKIVAEPVRTKSGKVKLKIGPVDMPSE
jgi:phenylacetate-CoA ligase